MKRIDGYTYYSRTRYREYSTLQKLYFKVLSSLDRISRICNFKTCFATRFNNKNERINPETAYSLKIEPLQWYIDGPRTYFETETGDFGLRMIYTECALKLTGIFQMKDERCAQLVSD